MKQNNNIKKEERFGLQALRGIGITGIVLYHLFPSEFCGGFLGVPLFFVLSGYLMYTTSHAAWEKGNFHIVCYYKKRLAKLYPPLFTLIAVICCYLTLFEHSRLAGRQGEIRSILFGFDNLWQIQQNTSYFSRMANASPFTHLWFLSMELQFYLVWPVLFLLYQKGCQVVSGRKLCFVFLIMALISAGWMRLVYIPGQDPSRVYYGTDTMAFPLLLGIFLGAFRQQYPNFRHTFRKKRNAIVIFGLFVLTTILLFVTIDGQSDLVYQGGMFVVSLGFAFMICLMEDNSEWLSTLLESSLISLLGKKSYWIYLWHYPVAVLAFL